MLLHVKDFNHGVFFSGGKVYVLYTSQGPIIKQICEGKNDEHVLIVSDNTARYQEFQLHKSEIIDIAIVIGVIRLE
jgi:phage repressor protein C with HTH and peptisase S24 domain